MSGTSAGYFGQMPPGTLRRPCWERGGGVREGTTKEAMGKKSLKRPLGVGCSRWDGVRIAGKGSEAEGKFVRRRQTHPQTLAQKHWVTSVQGGAEGRVVEERMGTRMSQWSGWSCRMCIRRLI